MTIATARIIAALLFIFPILTGRISPVFLSHLDQFSLQRNVPPSIVVSVCMHESGAGSTPIRAVLCGIQTRVLRTLIRRNIVVPSGNSNIDQLNGATYILQQGKLSCRTWERAANYYRSGNCNSSPENYGRRVVRLSNRLETTARRIINQRE